MNRGRSFAELVLSNRSYRRFDQSLPVGRDVLVEMVDTARLSASAGNKQPLKFFISYSDDRNQTIFSTLGWAGYLKDWAGPAPEERPTGYIVLLTETPHSPFVETDCGIAAQTILLMAADKGLGGCLVYSVQRDILKHRLGIPADFGILGVIAIGAPIERVVIEEVKASGDIAYWRDCDGVHHVPKRSLQSVLME